MIKVNDVEMLIEHFPNGESKIKPIDVKGKEICTELIYENNDDLINLMLIKYYLDEKYPMHSNILSMAYIPYERMDRETKNQIFTSKYFGQFINRLGFDAVGVFDPHSNVSIASIENTVNIPVMIAINQIKEDFDYIFFPDNGAKKKYVEVLDPLPVPYFYGDKHRDLETGIITDYAVFNAPDITGKTVLIIDDLCVKGYTTLFAAKKLKELGASKVLFYCSHCEQAIFDGELLTTDYVDKIYTTNSLKHGEHEKIEIVCY